MKKRLTAILLSAGLVLTGLWNGAVPAAAAVSAPAETENTAEQDGAAETGEEKAFPSLIGNLARYMPEGAEENGIDADAYGAREKVTGIAPAMPSEGDIKTLVIIAGFQDYQYDEDFEEGIKSALFKDVTETSTDDPNYPKESLRAYYQRASFNKLKIGGEFYEWTSPHNRSWYDNSAQSNAELYQEILDAWQQEKIESWRNASVSGNSVSDNSASDNSIPEGSTDLERFNNYLKDFDADGNGELDCVYFLCPGGNTGWGTQWWSYRDNRQNTVGSYGVPYVIQVVDSLSSPGVTGQDNVADYLETYIHETGHQLGLDDYYSYDSDLDKTQTFAMMNNNMGDQDGFAKMLLGWLPKENIKWVTSSGQVSLRSYSDTGDVALITLPTEYDNYGIYSQFILAERFTGTGNDAQKFSEGKIADGTDNKAKIPDPGFRFYHIYARLNSDETAFLASNTVDKKLPLISAYRLDPSKTYSIYRTGNELTPTTVPDTSFFNNDFLNDGMNDGTELYDSGISITNLNPTAGTFEVSFSSEAENYPRPLLESACWKYDSSEGYYIECTFDRAVVPGGKGAVSIYDVDLTSEEPIMDPSQKWGEITEIRRSLKSVYSTKPNVLYFMVDSSIYRNTDGMLVIPKGAVISAAGVAAQGFMIPISYTGDVKDGNPHIPAPMLWVDEKTGAEGTERTLEISNIPDNSTVYYTWDDTEPTTQSEVYKEPLAPQTGVLKAIALDSEGNPVTSRFCESYNFRKVEFTNPNPVNKLTLAPGEFFQLQAEVKNPGSFGQYVTFASSDLSVVSVDKNGLLHARGQGEAEITVSSESLSTGGTASCKVTVTESDAALNTLKTALKEACGKDDVSLEMKELAKDLNGAILLSEFMESGYGKGMWIASVESQVYTGKAIKPEVTVYDGVKKLEKKAYTVSYKKNTNAGIAQITVKPKGKGQKAVTGEFQIDQASLGEEIILLPQSLKYTGKAQKPKPVLIDTRTGAKVPFSTKNFTVTYYDPNQEAVKSVKEEGTYEIMIEAKSPNYYGSTSKSLTVAKTNLIEKLKFKFKSKSLSAVKDANGNVVGRVIPTFKTDYEIVIPDGYYDGTSETDKEMPKLLSDLGLKATCYNNLYPGKMALVIEPTDNSSYVGSQVIYLTIKK